MIGAIPPSGPGRDSGSRQVPSQKLPFGKTPVRVRVLGGGEGDLWRVRWQEQELEVLIRHGAQPGRILKGFFLSRGKTPEFVPQSKSDSSPSQRPERPAPGPSHEAARQTLLRILLRGTTIPGPEKIEELLKLSRSTHPSQARKRAALAARCALKGLSPSETDFNRLYALLEGLSEEGEGQEGESWEEWERGDKMVPPITEQGEEGSPLPLFNHLAEGDTSWIIIPYASQVEGETYSGSLRLRYNRSRKASEAAVLSVRAKSGGEPWYFLWSLGERRRMRVFAGTGAAPGHLEELSRKLRKQGLEFDDILYNEEIFDGFDWEQEQLYRVDEMV